MKKVCENVQFNERCVQVPAMECSDLPQESCETVMEKQCSTKELKQCSNVPSMTCDDTPHQVCLQVPRQTCQDVEDCQNVPKVGINLSLRSVLQFLISNLISGDLPPGSQDDLSRHARPGLQGEEGLQHGGQARGEGDHGEEVHRGMLTLLLWQI